jgi:putative flippase GtrA
LVTEAGRTSPFFGLTWQALRYLLVAGTTSLVYLGLFAGGLALGLWYIVAILCAQVIVIFGAFPFYRRFVFQSRSNIRLDFLRFLTVWVSGAIAGLIVTPLLVELLHWQPFFSQVLAIAVVSILSFLSHRYFSFRTKPDQEGVEQNASESREDDRRVKP